MAKENSGTATATPDFRGRPRKGETAEEARVRREKEFRSAQRAAKKEAAAAGAVA